jgi:hypothetical protein
MTDKAKAAQDEMFDFNAELMSFLMSMHEKGYSDVAMGAVLIVAGDGILKHGAPWSQQKPDKPN